MSSQHEKIKALQARIGYHFADIRHLHRALKMVRGLPAGKPPTQKQHQKYQKNRRNAEERHRQLELLGDGVIKLVVRERGLDMFSAGKGDASFRRLHTFCSKAESNIFLALMAEHIGLTELIPSSARANGYLPKTYANYFEALLGAIVRDSSYAHARKVVEHLMPLGKLCRTGIATLPKQLDYRKVRSQLRHWIHRHGKRNSRLRYNLCEPVKGFYIASVSLDDTVVEGTSANKRKALQFAALNLLVILEYQRLARELFGMTHLPTGRGPSVCLRAVPPAVRPLHQGPHSQVRKTPTPADAESLLAQWLKKNHNKKVVYEETRVGYKLWIVTANMADMTVVGTAASSQQARRFAALNMLLKLEAGSTHQNTCTPA